MSNKSKSFTELINDEIMTELMDEALKEKKKFENNEKFNHILIKLSPLITSIVLFMGLINLMSHFPDSGKEPNQNSNIFLT